MAQDVSFGMLETPIRAEDAHRCFFTDPGDRRIDAFRSLNAFGRGSEILRPGQLLVVPHDVTASAAEETSLRSLAEGARRASPATASPIQAKRFNEEFDFIDFLTSNREAIGITGTEIGGLHDYLEKRVKLIEGDLKKLDDGYRAALKRGLPLNSAEAKALRRPVEEALQRQINGFSRRHILRNSGATTIKKGLGISHKSIAKSYRLHGDQARNKAIDEAVERSAAFASKLKPIGTVGKILDAGAIVGAVNAGYEKDGVGGAVAAGGKSAAGFLGARAGSALAAALLVGVGTGGVGFVVMGLGIVAGSIAGGAVAEGLYDVATDGLGEMIARVAE
ncbi:hypothetical protein [Jiella avicenniae]|uniref:Uncharacterized protein n=1 Tax=Jiella avicenniae TaxID=2907202 RepID=A0A9X1NY34_9HYPH|nr:hypothetical protein [Jiella avicenniae]MCE7027855.1 hypothetical protein [Jiella avicenniae]